ncbi:MAG: amino acid aminotransferase [Candidatus Latescibacterota bacterium]|nr:amino acid aminotransferase [Candidatus Latescibacterota bacterium]
MTSASPLSHVEAAPADPILGLSAAFARDGNPDKINLGVGEYRDVRNDTPILAAVSTAQTRILKSETSKRYLSIDGSPEYGAVVRDLVLGNNFGIEDERCAVVQAPGGTGALRVAGDFIHTQLPGTRLWLSDPTWANHPKIFSAAGVETAEYRYYDAHAHGLDYDGFRRDLEKVPAGEAVLLHGCCHNPTGVDLQPDQWDEIGGLLAARGVLPLVDFAYQGFGNGLEEDAAGLRMLARQVPDLFVANSFSKNFGLYRERVGALLAVTESAEATANVLSQLKICIRSNFSNPPAHGSAIVTEILGDPALRSQWLSELTVMRDRINGMRALLVERLEDRGVAKGSFDFILDQRGMFSFSGLSPEQVDRLRKEYAIYIVDSGRINVAGITLDAVDYLCDAIASVL